MATTSPVPDRTAYTSSPSSAMPDGACSLDSVATGAPVRSATLTASPSRLATNRRAWAASTTTPASPVGSDTLLVCWSVGAVGAATGAGLDVGGVAPVRVTTSSRVTG